MSFAAKPFFRFHHLTTKQNITKTFFRFSQFKHNFEIRELSSRIRDKSIELKFDNNHLKEFGFKWLRDHCNCESCLFPKSKQRIFDTKKVKNIERPISANVENDHLLIEWKDGHRSNFKADWLQNISNNNKEGKSSFEPLLHPKHWDVSYFKDNQLPSVSYLDVMKDDSNEGIKEWMKMIAKFGFAIVNGIPSGTSNTHNVIRKISFPRQNVYGEFWHLKWNEDESKEAEHSDTAYSTFPLHPHTDCTYFIDTPGLQFFQIPVHTGNGGENTLVDSFRVIEVLKSQYPESYQYFLDTPLPFRMYENGAEYQTYDNILRFDLYSGKLIQFRYNNDDRSPYYVPPEKEDLHYEAIINLLELTQSPEYMLQFKLSPDQLLVTNNWRVMHGRKEFQGHRELVGAYITMEEFLRKYRSLDIQ